MFAAPEVIDMANLGELGLSEYEARVYRTLLETGPTTAKELSNASDVPMGRIYDVLNSLEQYDLVRSQSASRPKRYVAVGPAIALDRLLEAKKRELEAQAERYETIVDELADELESTESTEETFWTAAIGRTDAANLVVERLSTADSEVVVVLSEHSEQFLDVDAVGSLVFDELEAALERDVEVRLLLRPALAADFRESIDGRYRTSLGEHGGFSVRASEDATGRFALVDEREVLVEVPRPLESRRVFAVVDLGDRDFARSISAAFESRWETAERIRL